MGISLVESSGAPGPAGALSCSARSNIPSGDFRHFSFRRGGLLFFGQAEKESSGRTPLFAAESDQAAVTLSALIALLVMELWSFR
jgi:hypothetical protein